MKIVQKYSTAHAYVRLNNSNHRHYSHVIETFIFLYFPKAVTDYRRHSHTLLLQKTYGLFSGNF